MSELNYGGTKIRKNKYLIFVPILLMLVADVHAVKNLKRISTTALGAEYTGLFIFRGQLFFNAQHPDNSNQSPYNRATVGYVSGASIGEIVAAGTIGVPKNDTDKQNILVNKGNYVSLFQEGDYASQVLGGLGAIVAIDGHTIIRRSNDPDFNAVIPINDKSAYLYTNWEATPGGMSRVKIDFAQDGSNRWIVDANDIAMLDFASVNGTWLNCFGTVSPWGTPLSSEELYFDNTSQWNNPKFGELHDQLDMKNYLGGRFPNPYHYGYIVEILDPTGNSRPEKHFTMGRFSHENAVVMPDKKTVYLSDDGTGTAFFKFIADRVGDLSAGTLYAAKAFNVGPNPAEHGLEIEWVKLAHATNRMIERWIDEYGHVTPEHYKARKSSYISDSEIKNWAEGRAADDRVAFLESRKAAAAKGATAEFRKMEGVNINYEGAKDFSVPYMYMAMSSIDKTMSDGKGDIRFKKNKCGVVYRMTLNSDYDINFMQPVVAGGPYNRSNSPNSCPVDSISNPDNLLVLSDGSVIVGEDTDKHENNMLWYLKFTR